MRSPAVAGAFYAGDASQLTQQIEECFNHKLGPKDLEPKNNAIGAVVPHAGYVYSGPVAAHIYKAISQKDVDTFIIFGPNHTGLGSGVSVMTKGSWMTPLGQVDINTKLAEEIVNKSDLAEDDEMGHLREHSIEVQLPFLQYSIKKFTFVPICLMIQDLFVAKSLGETVGKICKDKNVMILASSDFTHYEPKEIASEKDHAAIEHILNLDPDSFIKEVKEKHLSICGYGPILTTLYALKEMGLRKASLLKYATSGDVHSMPEVVGYAAILFEK